MLAKSERRRESVASRVVTPVGTVVPFIRYNVVPTRLQIGIAFIAMWFVREVPLVDHVRLDSASEIGTEILAEEAMQPAEHEPVIVGEPEAVGSWP